MSKLETIFELKNTKNISMQGLKFQHTAFYGMDTFNTVQGAIMVQNSDGITIKNSQVSNTAMNGVFIVNSKNVNIQQNVFLDIGYLGVKAAGPKLTENLMISNNYLDGCGMTRFWQPVCIGVVAYKNVYIRNNEVTNTANGGIQVITATRGSTFWSDQGITTPTRNDYVYHIEFNHVHNFGHGILSDYGAIKTGTKYDCDYAPYDDFQKNCHAYTHVYNNLLHDGKSYFVGANMIYSDCSSSRNTFENNIIYGDGEYAMKHHCGVDNVSKNNIVHRTPGAHAMSMLGACEANQPTRFQTISNYNNIYLFEDVVDLHLAKKGHRFDNGNSPAFHQNIYWSRIGGLDTALFPGNLNWTDWSQLGNDVNSVWTDPKLVNPSPGQYVLAPDSPALAMGIKQIQLDNFGIEKNVSLFFKKTK